VKIEGATCLMRIRDDWSKPLAARSPTWFKRWPTATAGHLPNLHDFHVL